MKKVLGLVSYVICQSIDNASEIIENTYTEEYKEQIIGAVEEVVDAYQGSDLPRLADASHTIFRNMTDHINLWTESLREDLDKRLAAKFNGEKFE